MKYDEMISVIIPVYNAEQYVETALTSLCNQTYDNLEIIVVDDGSTDNTLKYVQKCAAEDARIKVVHQENKGVSAARNVGLSISSGNIIGFVDGDDWCEENEFETMYRVMNDNDADVVICSLYFDYPQNSTIQCGACSRGELLIMNQEQAINEMFKGELFSGHLHNKLFRRHIVEELQFNEQIKVCEDTLFCLSAFNKCSKIVYVAEPLYHYCIRQTSSYHQRNFNAIYSAHTSYQLMEQLIKSKELPKFLYKNFVFSWYSQMVPLSQLAIETNMVSDKRYSEIKWKLRKHYFRVLPKLNNKMKLIYGLVAINPRIYYFYMHQLKK